MNKAEWYEIADMAAEYVVSELYPIVLYPSKASRQVRKDEKEKFSGAFLRIITAKLSSPCPFTGDSEKAEVFDEENDTFPYVVCSKWPDGCGECARSKGELQDKERANAIYDYYTAETFWESLSEAEQIQVAAVVFRKLVDHAQTRSSFRCLLYDEFGWSAKAYSAIYAAGGMTIHNILSGAMMEEDADL